MRRSKNGSLAIFLILLLLSLILIYSPVSADTKKQLIYDYAEILTPEEINHLEAIASKYGAKRETDFIILTANDTEGKDIMRYMQDFYDEQAPGFDQPHGNTAILTIDMEQREIYLAGFYKAKAYLDNNRLDSIRDKITPDLSKGHYEKAFEKFIKTSYKYMGIKPGVDPDNVLFNIWFQLTASITLAGVIVGLMAYHSGGKVTIHAQTYQDTNTSRVLQREDRYIRTTTTKRRKPSDKNKRSGFGGGVGGGGITRSGHSHSGSRGRF